MADILAADVSIEDLRPGANAGIRRGRKNSIDDMRAAVEVGFTHITSKVVATRGNDIALMLVHASGSGAQEPDAFQLDIYHVVEADSDGRTKAVAVFDIDAVGAAFAELDSRYLAGKPRRTRTPGRPLRTRMVRSIGVTSRQEQWISRISITAVGQRWHPAT